MILKNKKGELIDIVFTGALDDIQVSCAVKVNPSNEVPEEDIEYILEKYADEIYSHRSEELSCLAYDLAKNLRKYGDM